MTETDPVSVTVEIVDNFSDDIQQLKEELRSIQEEIGVTLDIDDDGDIDWAKMELESLEDVIEVLLDLDTRGFKSAFAKKEALSKDTSSTHHIKTQLDDDLQALSGFDPPDIDWGEGGSWMEDFQVDEDWPIKKGFKENIGDHMDAEGIFGKAEVTPDVETPGGDHPAGDGRFERPDPLGGHALFEGWFGKSKVDPDVEAPGKSDFFDSREIKDAIDADEIGEALDRAASVHGQEDGSFGLSGDTVDAIEDLNKDLAARDDQRDSIKRHAAFEGWTGKSKVGGDRDAPGSGHIADDLKRTLNDNDLVDRLDELNALQGGEEKGSYGLTGSTAEVIEDLEDNLQFREDQREAVERHAAFEGWEGKSKTGRRGEVPGGSGESLERNIREATAPLNERLDNFGKNTFEPETPDVSIEDDEDDGKRRTMVDSDIVDRLDDLSALQGGDREGSYGLTGKTADAIEDLNEDLNFRDNLRESTERHAAFEGWTGKSKLGREGPIPGKSDLDLWDDAEDEAKKTGRKSRNIISSDFAKGIKEGVDNGLKKSRKSVRDWSNKVKGNFSHGFDVGRGKKGRRDSDGGGILGNFMPDMDILKKFANNPFEGKDGGSLGLMEGLKKAVPSVRTWMKLIAVLLPMVIALAAAVGGLVTALLAVGIAAGTAFAFGAWGLDDLEGRINRLKEELSSLFEPVKNTFEPFVRGFLGTLPRRLEPLVDAFQRMTVFEDTIIRAFEGLVGWIAKGMHAMADYKEHIDEILATVGSASGDSIINFFKWLVEETANNKEEFLELAGVLKNVIAAVYYVSKAVSFAVANFSFLFDWLRGIAEFLDSRFMRAVLTVIVGVGLLALAVNGVNAALGIMTGGLLAKAIFGLGMYFQKALIATKATLALGKAIAFAFIKIMLIVGALLVLIDIIDRLIPGLEIMDGLMPGGDIDAPDTPGGGGGGGGGGPGMGPTAAGAGGGGGGGNLYINIEGDTDKDSLNKLNDKLEDKWKTYSSRKEERDMDT